MLKSKIHRAKVTGKNIHYEGSITIDEEIATLANIMEFERVDIYNITNGERFSTYVLLGEKGSGAIELNGAAARKAEIGDIIIIASFAVLNENEVAQFKPTILFLDNDNHSKDESKTSAHFHKRT